MKESIAAAQLDEWLKTRGMKKAFFAEKIGVLPGSVSRWLKGEAPTMPTRLRIEDVTGGAVKAGDWE